MSEHLRVERHGDGILRLTLAKPAKRNALDDDMVAVFQGVPGEIAGLQLHSEHKRSDTNVNDLTDVAQDAVRKGIAADSRADAEKKMDDLTTDRLKLCPPGPTPSGPEPDANDYPSTAGSSAPAGGLNGSPTPSSTPDASTGGSGSLTSTPSPSPSNCRNSSTPTKR